MPRKVSTGRVGGPILGSLSTSSNTFLSVETNANIAFSPDGTGIVESNSDIQLNNGNSIILADDDSSSHVAIKAPGTLSATYTLTLPPNDGTPGQSLLTDGDGVLTWSSASVAVTNQIADTQVYYPTITTSTSGVLSAVATSNTKLTFQPSSGTLTATNFNGTSSTLTGSLTAQTITETSSITLKENINPIQNALGLLLQLRGVTYDRKDKTSINEAGFIAEEVEPVLPNLVVKDADGNPYGINYTKFSAYLIEALKTLANEIEDLKGNK